MRTILFLLFPSLKEGYTSLLAKQIAIKTLEHEHHSHGVTNIAVWSKKPKRHTKNHFDPEVTDREASSTSECHEQYVFVSGTFIGEDPTRPLREDRSVLCFNAMVRLFKIADGPWEAHFTEATVLNSAKVRVKEYTHVYELGTGPAKQSRTQYVSNPCAVLCKANVPS